MACIDSLGRGDEGRIEDAFINDIQPVSADTPLTELMTQVAESAYPVPVVDENGRYKGSISRATLLHTLDRTDKGAA
jgi:glycine betaine/proline transport system ATP-binding protein